MCYNYEHVGEFWCVCLLTKLMYTVSIGLKCTHLYCRLPFQMKHPDSIEMKAGGLKQMHVTWYPAQQSIKLKWSGDVDFGDGKLQWLYKSYHQRLQGFEDIDFLKFKSNPKLVLATCACMLNEQNQLKPPPNGCDTGIWAPPMKGLKAIPSWC